MDEKRSAALNTFLGIVIGVLLVASFAALFSFAFGCTSKDERKQENSVMQTSLTDLPDHYNFGIKNVAVLVNNPEAEIYAGTGEGDGLKIFDWKIIDTDFEIRFLINEDFGGSFKYDLETNELRRWILCFQTQCRVVTDADELRQIKDEKRGILAQFLTAISNRLDQLR